MHRFKQGLQTRLWVSRVLVSYINVWKPMWELSELGGQAPLSRQLSPGTAMWENENLWLTNSFCCKKEVKKKSGFLCYLWSADKELEENLKPSEGQTTRLQFQMVWWAVSLLLLIKACRIYRIY